LARSAEAASSFTIVLMFIPYVSTSFVPAHTMPAALRGFAEHQPFTPIVETMRGLWMGHTTTGATVGHEAWLRPPPPARPPPRARAPASSPVSPPPRAPPPPPPP